MKKSLLDINYVLNEYLKISLKFFDTFLIPINDVNVSGVDLCKTFLYIKTLKI